MKDVTIKTEGMNLAQRKLAQSVALIHNTKHWSVRKKLYKTSKGLFAVRCAKTIIVRLVK
ncbi:hypothetical protein NVP1210O_74 [Vibrio phage 1.210.O._10N.222.52.C2]|nr:hypothetical protein NVP1210O_74 [Vibrio phage 1.210.O._10N.222.52.C2]